jgi:hypothetical protein
MNPLFNWKEQSMGVIQILQTRSRIKSQILESKIQGALIQNPVRSNKVLR